MESIKAFYTNNTEISIAILVGVIIYLVVKPKEIGKLLTVIAVMAIIGFLTSAVIDVVNKGSEKKGEASSRTERSYEGSEK